MSLINSTSLKHMYSSTITVDTCFRCNHTCTCEIQAIEIIFTTKNALLRKSTTTNVLSEITYITVITFTHFMQNNAFHECSDDKIRCKNEYYKNIITIKQFFTIIFSAIQKTRVCK